MRVIHQAGSPYGVPTMGIPAAASYHSVVIELPFASTAITPLMNLLKKEVSSLVIRKSATDYLPRIHLTVGYLIGEFSSDELVVENFTDLVEFKVRSFVLDFPKVEGFENVEIGLNGEEICPASFQE